MEQLWNYVSHVYPIFCTFHKNCRFCWGPLNLLFHRFTLFGKFLNFAKIFQFFSNLQFSLPVYCFFTNAVNFQICCNFFKCMQTWTYLCYYYLCFTIHWQGSVYGVYLVKCSSNHYLKMPSLCMWVQPDRGFV